MLRKIKSPFFASLVGSELKKKTSYFLNTAIHIRILLTFATPLFMSFLVREALANPGSGCLDKEYNYRYKLLLFYFQDK